MKMKKKSGDDWATWIARERYKDKFKEKDFYSYSAFGR